jgi:type II secretory pathway pseudopilin PulG
MKSDLVKDQAGYTLLLVMLAMVGMGGVVAVGFVQEARQEAVAQRYEHNQRVLKEAKQALLMYAYNYPQFLLEGPGRLPCPDTDNDGLPGVPGPLTIPICESVGRLPWGEPNLEFYDARDASNENLWYAVSNQFYNLGGGPVINSNSAGTITLFDQSGGIINDGTGLGAYPGIAAVIIAPGPSTNRDEDDNGSYEYTQIRGTVPQRNDPRNYLDTFPGGFDNSVFINAANNSADGFSLGPIYDPVVNDYVLNDQMIVITTEEVIAMAQKSVLDTYQDSINTYLNNTAGIYPWLDDFATVPDLLTSFDGDFNIFKGRVPAVFSSYFTGDAVDAYPSGTKIRLEMPASAPAPGGVIIHTPPPAWADVSFIAGGDLVTSLNSLVTVTRYFWDGHPTQANTLPMDGVWEMCPVVTNDEEDCNLDNLGTYIGGAASAIWTQVYKLTITLNSGAGALQFSNAQLIPPAPHAYIPATNAEHAYVFGNYSDGATSISIDWEFDLNFQGGFLIQAFGNLTDAAVGVVYYPELPDWALDDQWHHSVQMAIAEDYKPDGNNTDCNVNGCLTVANLGGVNNDKISLLVIADQIDNLADDNAPGFLDDLTLQFEAENDTTNLIYDRRAGNDSVLVLQ